MQKLISFFKQYAFEWLVLIFSVGIPFALGMGPAFYGILATFLIFLTLRRLSYWVFFIVFLFTFPPSDYLVWASPCYHDRSFF